MRMVFVGSTAGLFFLAQVFMMNAVLFEVYHVPLMWAMAVSFANGFSLGAVIWLIYRVNFPVK